MKKLIEFKKQRELGEIISDTFAFIREEFNPFLKTVLQISGPYLILFLISMSFYIYTSGDLFNFKIGEDFSNISSLPLMFGSLLLFMITGVLAYVFANSAVLHYIKSYIENEGNVNLEEVKNNVKQTLWGFLGLGILKWMTLIFAIVLCFLPVLYAMVPMYVIFSIYIFENKDATDSYSFSFTLINSDFWMTLFTIIILGFIVMTASYVFSLPAAIYSIIKMGIFSGEMDPESMMDFVDPVYILLNIFSYLFKFLLNLILTVSSAFIYFNLNEKLNFTGTYERIQSLGKKED